LEETNKDEVMNEEGGRTNFFERPFDQEETSVPMQEPEPVHFRPNERRPAMNDSQVSTPQLSTHSSRTKRNVLASFLGRRASSDDLDHDSMVMTPTQSPSSPTRHSSQPAEGKLVSKFPNFPNSFIHIHYLFPQSSPSHPLLSIPSLILFCFILYRF
jgi:hypothetical protein